MVESRGMLMPPSPETARLKDCSHRVTMVESRGMLTPPSLETACRGCCSHWFQKEYYHNSTECPPTASSRSIPARGLGEKELQGVAAEYWGEATYGRLCGGGGVPGAAGRRFPPTGRSRSCGRAAWGHGCERACEDALDVVRCRVVLNTKAGGLPQRGMQEIAPANRPSLNKCPLFSRANPMAETV